MRQDMMVLASNSLQNLRGQKWPCPCYHARHLQQFHWSKLLCGMYSFTAKSSIALLNICQILMRLMFLQMTNDRKELKRWFIMVQFCVKNAQKKLYGIFPFSVYGNFVWPQTFFYRGRFYLNTSQTAFNAYHPRSK